MDDKPPWYDSKLSDLINLPNNNYKQLNHSIKKKFFAFRLTKDFYCPIGYYSDHNIDCISYKFDSNIIDKFSFKDINVSDPVKEITNIHNKLEHDIINIHNSDLNPLKKQTKIKTLITKAKKNISMIDKTTICRKFSVFPNDQQKKLLDKIFNECNKVYNWCVNKYKLDPSFFNNDYTIIKTKIFYDIYGDNKKEYYDILTDEIRIFCSNLKSSKSNIKNCRQKKFIMHERNTKKSQCILIPLKSINKNGIFIRSFGKMDGFDKINTEEINNDCRLFYDKINKKYIMLIPINIKRKTCKHREPIVALDPGEKVFISYYGLNTFGQIGINIRSTILEYQEKIKKMQRILSKRKNRKNKKLRNKGKIQRKIQILYNKIKNIVKELHNQTALYLCKNYDRILIPKFETQKMVRKVRKKTVEKIYKEEGFEKGKEILRKYQKENRLNSKIKFVLNMLSHYKFREHLKKKSNEYGCQIKIVTEEDTSKTCTKCGNKSKTYKKREKECPKCGYKIDRDINGSRNILIKNIKKELRLESLKGRSTIPRGLL